MKDEQTIRRLIELRAQAWNFARIAAELRVSKTNLIQWTRQRQCESKTSLTGRLQKKLTTPFVGKRSETVQFRSSFGQFCPGASMRISFGSAFFSESRISSDMIRESS
jgi:hypothetical protein